MGYLVKSPGITPEQQKQLLDVSKEEIELLPVATRLELALKSQDVKAREKAAFWSAISTAFVVAVPVLAYLGISLSTNKDK